MALISGSEVDSYQQCPKQHYYAFELRKTPVNKKKAVRTGNIGHAAFSAYYKAKQEGLNHEECVKIGTAAIADYFTEDNSDGINIVTRRFLLYTDFYRNEPIRILDVEGSYGVDLGGGITYVMTLDLLIEATSGKYKGEIGVIDHKWTDNFWTANQTYMNSQLPRYISTLRKIGYDVTIGIFNQVRYRAMKDETPENIFQRSIIEPTDEFIKSVMNSQYKTSMEIASNRLRGPSFVKKNAIPHLRYINCRGCFFQIPCAESLDGRDDSLTLNTSYETNTYGYDDKEIKKEVS